MFEIMKALRNLNEVCMAHGTSLRWNNTDGEGGLAIRAEIPLTEEDFAFIEQMREFFGPVDEA
jgi:hypothetical protein